MHSAECIEEVKMPRSFIDLFMRGSRNFRQGGKGGGVNVQLTENKVPTTFLQRGVQWFIARKTNSFRVPEGVQHFPRGGVQTTFPGGGGGIANSCGNL